MNPNLPDWISFEPSDGRLPVGLGGEGTDNPGAGMVACVVDPSIDSGWAAEAAVSMARSWVQGGTKVLLADLFLDDPVLNGTLGVENADGVSDVFLYGASIRHVARPIQAGGYLLATAGTAVADGAAVLSHERWGPVLDGFREAGVLLVALVPADAPGLDSLLARARGVVHLAGSSASSIPTQLPVLARLGPAEASDRLDPPSQDTVEPPETVDSAQSGGMFDMESLPGDDADVDATAAEGGDELFSMDSLGGGQYDAGGESDGDVDATPEPESTAVEADDFDFGGGLEMEIPEPEPVAAESEETEAEPEPEPAPEPEPEIQRMEIESSMLMDDSTLDSLSSTGSMMEGIETGAGFEMPSDEEEPDFDAGAGLKLDAPFGGEPEVEAEVDTPEEDDGFDFGGGALEMEAPPEVEEVADDPMEDSDSLVEEPAGGEFGALEEDFGTPEDEDADDAPFLDPAAELSGGNEGTDEGSDEAADEGNGGRENRAEAAVADSPVVEAPSEAEPPAPAPTDTGKKRVTQERKLTGLEKLERAQKRKARTRTLMIAVLATIVLGGGGYGLMFTGLIQVPGVTPESRLRSAVMAPTELSGPTPSTPVMTYSLLTQSYNDFVAAWELATSLSRKLPEALFFVAPVDQDGRTRWGLFAGPAYSAVEAEALRQPVDDAFANNFDATVWRVSPSSYAFFFGEYPGFSEAQDRVDGLLGQEIPSYVLQVDHVDGSRGYRVYGGAYGDEFQAVPMREILRERGLTDIPLTERRGKRPE
jgi:hypothetical protein